MAAGPSGKNSTDDDTDVTLLPPATPTTPTVPAASAAVADKTPKDVELLNPGVLSAYDALGPPKSNTPSVFFQSQNGSVVAQISRPTSTRGSVSTDKSNFYFRSAEPKEPYEVPSRCCVIS